MMTTDTTELTDRVRHRHLASSSRDLLQLVNSGIKAVHLSEDLYSVPANMTAKEARSNLEKRGFDTAGVSTGESIEGYVLATELQRGTCGEHTREFSRGCLVSDSTPRTATLEILSHRQHVFVLSGKQVNRIITRGDLQKAPVRMFLFALVSLLEMNLLNLIRLKFPTEEEWQTELSPTRLQKARELHEERKRLNEDLDIADCLQLCDKADLLLKAPGGLEALGCKTKSQARATVKSVTTLRNRLAHSQDLRSNCSWAVIAEMAGIVEEMVRSLEGAAKHEESYYREQQLMPTAAGLN